MSVVQPHLIQVSDATLASIKSGLEAYPWHAMPDTGGWSCGADVSFMRHLTEYWIGKYDWRARERLNHWPQFTAEVGGVRLHFYHLRGANPGRPG